MKKPKAKDYKIKHYRRLEKAARDYFNDKRRFRVIKIKGGFEDFEAGALRRMSKALKALEEI